MSSRIEKFEITQNNKVNNDLVSPDNESLNSTFSLTSRQILLNYSNRTDKYWNKLAPLKDWGTKLKLFKTTGKINKMKNLEQLNTWLAGTKNSNSEIKNFKISAKHH